MNELIPLLPQHTCLLSDSLCFFVSFRLMLNILIYMAPVSTCHNVTTIFLNSVVPQRDVFKWVNHDNGCNGGDERDEDGVER
jgi:hypothetical protein